jgi:Flp pilus assembly protein TadD
MNGKKIPGRPEGPHASFQTRQLAASVVLVLCTLFPVGPFNMTTAKAQESVNRITALSVSPQGELIIEVEGEGFDPMLKLESAPNGEYRIVVQGQGVTIDPEVSREMGQFGSQLQGRIPAIDKATIAAKSTGTQGEGFQLVLTAWRRLQPQIRINNGNQIVIGLIGERSLPQSLRLHRQKMEQQRIAALRHQEMRKKQAEQQKQIALQHQTALQQKAEAAQQANLQRQLQQQKNEQQRLTEIQREASARLPRQAAASQNATNNQYQAADQLSEQPTPHNAEADDDFAALIRQEAQRLAAQQQEALAHKNQIHNFLPDELSASSPQELAAPAPAIKAQAPTSAKTIVHQKHGQNLKHIANETQRQAVASGKYSRNPTVKSGAQIATLAANGQKNATTRVNAVPVSTKISTTNSSAPKTEWEQAYATQNPMSAGEFMAELQIAQQNHKADSDHSPAGNTSATSKKQSVASRPALQRTSSQATPRQADTKTQSTSHQPEPANQTRQADTPASYVPVNFNGPTGDTQEDNAPTDPLRLKKLPTNYVPEPDPEANPTTPVNVQPTIQAPAKSQSRTLFQSGAISPGVAIVPAEKPVPKDSIYAVINQPGAAPVLKQAWQSLMNGNAASAQAQLQQHLKNAPQDTGARYLLAEILLSPLSDPANQSGVSAAQSAKDLAARRANNRKEAQRQLLTNYAQSLHWPSCQALLELFIEDGKLPEASGLLKQLKQTYPNEAGVHYEDGRLQEAMDNLDAARTAYQKSLGLQPANAEAHYRLAQVELKTDHLEAAHWELLQALSWSPNDSRIYKLLGYIADRTGHKQEAAQAYREALPLDALLNYARSLEAQNQPERALSLYQAAETLAGDNGDILYNLAMIYSHSQRPARATAVLHRFLSLNGSRQNSQDQRITKAKSLLQQLEQQK